MSIDKNNIKSVTENLGGMFQSVELTDIKYVIKKYKRGEQVFENVDGIACVGVILSGKCDVYSVAYNGDKSNVSTLSRGGEFGICNIFTEGGMPTVIFAKVAAEVLYISKTDFEKLLSKDNSLLRRYLTLCNKKMLYLACKIELMGLNGAKSKLACYIMQNVIENEFELSISKEQLAKFLNVSRASLFRAFSDMQAEGIIECTGNNIKLINSEKIAEC